MLTKFISFAFVLLPCLRRAGAHGRLFIFKTVSRFQFYPEPDLEKHIYSGNPQTGRGDLGIRGNIWIKKSNKRRPGKKRRRDIFPYFGYSTLIYKELKLSGKIPKMYYHFYNFS